MNERKVIQTISYYLMPIFLLSLAYVNPDSSQILQFGSWALNLLTVIVFIKPLTIIFPNYLFKKLLSYRRELGVADLWLFLFHLMGMLFRSGVSIADIFLYPFSSLFWGGFAGIGIVILGITSNNFSVKFLRRNWKRLHMIVYPVFFAALYHGSMSEGEPEKFYILGTIYAVLKLLQFLKERQNAKKAYQSNPVNIQV